MKDLRLKLTRNERLDLAHTRLVMKPYIEAVLKAKRGDKCEICGIKHIKYDIHERLYNPRITVFECQLLCEACHKKISDFTPINKRNQYTKK